MRILGIDYGRKRIGVAISDPMGWTAQGLPTIGCGDGESGIEPLACLIRERGVERIVIGYPLDRKGEKGKAALEVDRFRSMLVQKLKESPERTVPPVELWDERFSSAEAERTLLEGDRSRAARQTELDRVAAVLILQGYLDSLRHREA